MKNDGPIKRRDFIKGSALVVAGAGAALPHQGSCGPEDLRPHRWIDQTACIGCGQCLPLCPMGAISLTPDPSVKKDPAPSKASIDPDECAECGVCVRSRVCPMDAIHSGELVWPRTLREVFSNPLSEHKSTGVAGRGTEGIKTNDSAGRYREGFMGVFIELGRPVLGARFADVEKVVKKFKARGYDLIPGNPVADLIAAPATGALDPEVLDEKVISCLVEFVMPDTKAAELQEMVRELSREVESVFNVCVALRAKPEGSSSLFDLFPADTYNLPNGKVNIGLAAGIKCGEG